MDKRDRLLFLSQELINVFRNHSERHALHLGESIEEYGDGVGWAVAWLLGARRPLPELPVARENLVKFLSDCVRDAGLQELDHLNARR